MFRLALRRLRARRWRAVGGAVAVAVAGSGWCWRSACSAPWRTRSRRAGAWATSLARERLVQVAAREGDAEPALAALGLGRPVTVRVGGPVSPQDERGTRVVRAPQARILAGRAPRAGEVLTPLAVMRTAIDVALEDPDARPTPRLEQMIGTLRDTLTRSEQLVERLLVLARGAHVETRLAPTTVHGDPVLLDQLVRNLVDNGVRHGAGTLEITTGEPALRVASDGEPLDEAQLPGRGIGLAIVRSVAAAHGGRVELTARPRGGLVVDVALPEDRHASTAW